MIVLVKNISDEKQVFGKRYMLPQAIAVLNLTTEQILYYLDNHILMIAYNWSK